jgi:hypothetical protein|nr:MAG TPA: homing endonuclease [Caudoviricetes sp.]
MGKKFIEHDEYMELIIYGNKRNGVIIFDKDDLEKVKKYNWTINSNGYAVFRCGSNHKNRETIRMHRYLLGYAGSKDVDHINGNRLDNRKSNLRVCTRAENLWNTVKQKHEMHNISTSGGKYRVEIMRNGNRYKSKFFKVIDDAINLRDTIYELLKDSPNQGRIIKQLSVKGAV